MEREESRDRKEGDFIGEKLPTLAFPKSAYGCYCLQVRAFPTGTGGAGWVTFRDFSPAYLYSEIWSKK